MSMIHVMESDERSSLHHLWTNLLIRPLGVI